MNVALPLGCVLGDKLSLLEDVIASVCILNCSLSLYSADWLYCDFICLRTLKATKCEWRVAGCQDNIRKFGSQQVSAAPTATSAKVCKTTTAAKT